MSAHERALAERAREQLGLITRAQLREVGCSAEWIDRQLRIGRLERLHPSVFRLGGVPDSWRGRLLAAVLLGGGGALASHRAAALLHQLDGLRTAPVEVTCRRSRHAFPTDVVVHRPLVFMDVDRVVVDAIPCTSVALTLINLGAVWHPDRVEEALDSAIRKGLVHVRFVRWRIDQLAARGRPGIGVMRSLLDTEERRRPHSVLERRLLRALERAGLPTPICQYEIYDVLGGFIARVDFCWPHLRVVLEVDGHGSHASRKHRAHDAERDMRISAQRYQVVHLTYEQVVDRPEAAMAYLADVLRAAA
jgi:very-short-patch-repair endonuclease